MKNNYKKLICIAIFAALPGAASAAPAEVTMLFPGALGQIVAAVATPIVNAIGISQQALMSATIDSSAKIADITEQRNLEAWKNQAKYAAQQHQQPAIDGCGGQSQAAFSGSVVDMSRAMSSAMKASLATHANNAPAESEQAFLVADTHRRDYCDKNTDPKHCADSANPNGSANSTGEPMPGADAKSGSLFTGAGQDGRVGNLTFDAHQMLAASKYIENTIDNSNSPRKLTPAELDAKDGSGKKYEGLRTVYEARMSLTRDTLVDILAQRKPIPGSTAILKAIKAGAPVGGADFITQRERSIKKWSPNGDVSPLELLDIEIGRRVDNTKWYEAINTQADTASLMREQTFMLALMLKMQYQQLRHGDVTASLSAVQSAENIKANMLPKISVAEQNMLRGISR